MSRKTCVRLSLEVALLGVAWMGLGPASRPASASADNWLAGRVTANQPNGAETADAPTAVTTQVAPLITYQGWLKNSGVSYNGTIPITFRLYTQDSGGAAFWTETQNVTVTAGLFTVALGAVTPLGMGVTYFDAQVWLGIQPSGAPSELTPRQMLTAAPYALSLVPGATIWDQGTTGYTAALWVAGGSHVGIYGSSDTQNAIVAQAGGASTSGVSASGSGTGGSGVSASGSGNDGHAVKGTYSGASTSCPGGSAECASAIYGSASGDAYGLYMNTTTRSAVIINSTGTFWDIYDQNSLGATHNGINTTGKLTVGGYATFAGGKSGYVVDIALNDGAVPLERGDVVVITGSASPVVGEVPVPRVARASEANATAVMGVVDALWLPCRKQHLEAGEACGGFEPGVATIQPGQYLSVVTLGAYKAIKVDATSAPVKPGDLLATSAGNGLAMRATELNVNGVRFLAPGTIIGKALGALDRGTGTIPVFVVAR